MRLSNEARVGLFFVVGVCLFGLMLEVGNRWKLFDRGTPYYTLLSSSTGLKQGDAVKLAGVDVGSITGIAVQDDRVRVNFEVKPGTRIHRDAVAGIRMSNMLGGQFLGLTFGTPGTADLPPGSMITSVESTNIDSLMENVGGLTREARQLVMELNRNQNEVMGKIAAMLDENRAAVRDSLTGLSSITAKIDRGDGSLAMLLNDKALYSNAAALTGRLNDLSARLERGEGTIGKLLTDEQVYRETLAAVKGMNEGMKNFTDIAQRINKGEGTAGKLVNDPALYDELRVTVANLKDITRKINDGQGTIGKLVNEDTLYRDATATLKKTEKAMDGLKDSGPISVLGSVLGTFF